MAKWLYIKNFSQKTLLAITLLCLSRLSIPLVLTKPLNLQIPNNSGAVFIDFLKTMLRSQENLKPATTKNLSQGLAATLKGALKYQWIKSTLGTL
ncbi:hypothetical protein BTM258_09910 [Helicobacter pylori]